MSDEDLFARATRALRDGHDGTHDGATRTRARVLALAMTARKRRRAFVLVIAPLAAALVMTTAWAASTGRIERWLEDVGVRDRPDRASAPAPTPVSTQAPPAPSTSTAAPDAPPAITEIADSGAAPTASVASPRPSISPSAPPPIAKASAGSNVDAGPSEEDALYQRAHQAHFVAHDTAGAVRAWDDYLRAYPKGRFALEARYNRGVALARLGRYAEARAALTPFANGELGGYRQSEARALLDAMDAGTK